MAQFKFIVGVVALDTAIKSIHTRGQKLQADIHRVACSTLKHATDHGDIRPFHKLLQAMPQAARVNSLRKWAETFGPVRFEGNEPHFVRGRPDRMAEAVASPFWDFDPETTYVPLDVLKMLTVMVKKLEKDATETGTDHSAVISAMKVQAKALEVQKAAAIQ